MSNRDKQVLDADWKSGLCGIRGGLIDMYVGACYGSIFEGIGIGFGWW